MKCKCGKEVELNRSNISLCCGDEYKTVIKSTILEINANSEAEAKAMAWEKIGSPMDVVGIQVKKLVDPVKIKKIHR